MKPSVDLTSPPPTPSDVIVVDGADPSRLIPDTSDGGLLPLANVWSRCVFRATRAPERAADDHLGWTYHHHVDMACWCRRLYVGWNTCERDEDVWPSRELFSSSTDGRIWTAPAELFPMGLSTPLRMYFFYSQSNAKMLVIAGQRLSTADTDEDTKAGLIVREIRPDHTLGEVFILRSGGASSLSLFRTSGDCSFVAACEQLLGDRVFLEQQDRGRLLDDDARMIWHRPESWPEGAVPGDDSKWVCGKAYSSFVRPDGTTVAISKMGWTSTTTDAGLNWTRPVVPPSLVTGKAKVWAQQTADGRYALAYNPSTRQRFPLVIVAGSDGVHFDNMRAIHADLPNQRYAGLHRSVGPQYVRGISRWSDDGSRAAIDGATSLDRFLWLVYSMNKEDIWVSRIALPLAGPALDQGWNVAAPAWSSVREIAGGFTVEDREAHGCAVLTYRFDATAGSQLRLMITLHSLPSVTIDMELRGADGQSISLTQILPDGLLMRGEMKIDAMKPGQPREVRWPLDAGLRAHSLVIRTGLRARTPGCLMVDPAGDVPALRAAFDVFDPRLT